MRSYRQFCALARALDVVGGRWTMLIVRELFSRDSRYSDLVEALPGIATNLLADRLRQLEADGVIESYQAPSPVRATVYRLTSRGRELAPVLRALLTWGAPLTGTGQGDDAFRTHWLALAVPNFFNEVDVSDLTPLTVLVYTGDEPATMTVGSGGVTMTVGAQPTEDAVVVEGKPEEVRSFLTGGADDKTSPGVDIRGPRDAVRRLNALVTRSRLAGPVETARA